jgi:hypothetical protein
VTATPEFREAQKTKKPCYGCEECGDTGGLYSNQHGGVYLCARCFFGKKPYSEGEIMKLKRDNEELRKKLALCRKVLAYIVDNVDAGRTRGAAKRCLEEIKDA